MSSVSSTGSDSGLGNYYHQTLRDLQDEIQTEAKRNQELRKEELDAIEKNYKAALQKKDLEAEDTIKNVKKETAQSLEEQKHKYNASLGDLKDRYEKSRHDDNLPGNGSGLGNYYHKPLTELEAELRADAKKNREMQEEEINRLQNSHRDVLLAKEQAANDTIHEAKELANKAITLEKEKNQAELDRIKNQTYNARGQIPGAIAPETHKREMQNAYDASQARHEQDSEKTDHVVGGYQQKIREMAVEHDNDLKKMMHSNSEDVRDLGDRIKKLNNYNYTLDKHAAELEDKRIRETENAIRSENSRLTEAFHSDRMKLKQNMKQAETDFARKQNQALQEKDEHFTQIINDQNVEAHGRIKNLESEFTSQLTEKENQRQHEQKIAAEHTEILLHRANAERQVALENQAVGYQETLDRTRKNYEDQINSLQSTLQKQRTTEDSKLISPGAEAAIRNNVTKNYEKSLDTEIDRNKRTTDHIHRKYIDQYKRAIEENADREALIHQTHEQEKASERNLYLESLYETEYNSGERLRTQESDHERERETLFRQFSNLLERQRRDYENILERSKNDSHARLNAQRQDLESRLKDTHRQLNTRNNELVREYDRKFADQRAENDLKFEELKSQAMLEQRDAERKARQELEALSKGYELRLAQQEAQSKERERYLAQNFQEEVDRIRRSYELLNKKKS